jgi:hypothetical protein
MKALHEVGNRQPVKHVKLNIYEETDAGFCNIL